MYWEWNSTRNVSASFLRHERLHVGETRRKGHLVVNTAREPRAYELMTILVPELAEEDLATQIQRISTHITTATGAIKETLTDSPWGRRRLAYSVRHNSQDYRDGYYIVFHFDLEPRRMTEIERELKLDVNVMRYLLVHDDPKAGEKDTSRPDSAEEPSDAPASTGEQVAVQTQSERPVDAPGAATTESSSDAPVPAQDAPEDGAEVAPAATAEGSDGDQPVAEPVTPAGTESSVSTTVSTDDATAPATDTPAPGDEAATDAGTDDTNDNVTREG